MWDYALMVAFTVAGATVAVVGGAPADVALYLGVGLTACAVVVGGVLEVLDETLQARAAREAGIPGPPS